LIAAAGAADVAYVTCWPALPAAVMPVRFRLSRSRVDRVLTPRGSASLYDCSRHVGTRYHSTLDRAAASASVRRRTLDCCYTRGPAATGLSHAVVGNDAIPSGWILTAKVTFCFTDFLPFYAQQRSIA